MNHIFVMVCAAICFTSEVRISVPKLPHYKSLAHSHQWKYVIAAHHITIFVATTATMVGIVK
jgi:hypothetical protein